METAILSESDMLHGHFVSFESGQIIYKTQGIRFLYFNSAFSIRFFQKSFSLQASEKCLSMISRGLEIPASVPHLSMLGKADTEFLLIFKTDYHTTKRGGCCKGGRRPGAELTTQSCVFKLQGHCFVFLLLSHGGLFFFPVSSKEELFLKSIQGSQNVKSDSLEEESQTQQTV